MCTINNPSQDIDLSNEIIFYGDILHLEELELLEEVRGQYERGENGTPHIQFLVSFIEPDANNFNILKLWIPKAHIEGVKSLHASIRYVTKEDSRITTVPRYYWKTPRQFITYHHIPDSVYRWPSDYDYQKSVELQSDLLPCESHRVEVAGHTVMKKFQYYWSQ